MQGADVRCEYYREAISARMDGEDVPELGTPSDVDTAVEEHLAGCAECREYADRAAYVTRLARIRPAEPGPDLLPGVLAATPDGPRRRSRRTRVLDGVRAALGALGVGQLGLAVSGVVAGTAGHDGHGELAGASMAHFSHESAAWNLAIGVAFLWVATGPARRSDGLVPVVGAFVALLLALSALDLLAERVDASRLVGHGVVVAGLVLLVLHRRLGSGGGGTARDDRRHDAGTGPATAERRANPAGTARTVDGGLEPTARRTAA
jgi:predicted anti-sigma-YlaC factor YlaD